jgi:hypothetical protein
LLLASHRGLHGALADVIAATAAAAAVTAAAATAVAAAAIAATVATAPAVAAIPTVAAIAAVATIAMAPATVAAAVAAAATIAAATVTTGETAKEGRRLVLTAHEGDSNQREKHRDTQNNDTVHPRILQLTYRYRKRELLSCRHTRSVPPRQPTAQRRDAIDFLAPALALAPQIPCEDLRITKTAAVAKVRS